MIVFGWSRASIGVKRRSTKKSIKNMHNITSLSEKIMGYAAFLGEDKPLFVKVQRFFKITL